MKKTSFIKLLVLLSIMLCWQQQSFGDDVYTLGERATVDNLKNGDLIILRNATCDVGKLRESWDKVDTYSPGKNQFLNGTTFHYFSYSSETTYPNYKLPTLDVLDPEGTFTSNYVFELDSVGITGPVSGKPTFHIKNVSSGMYLKAFIDNLGMFGVYPTNSESDATPFEFDNASSYSSWYTDSASYNALLSGWDCSTSLADENSIAIIYQCIATTSGSTEVNFFKPAWNMGYSEFRYDIDAHPDIMWNAYKATLKVDFKAKLTDLINSLADTVQTYSVGTNPGQYGEDAVQALQDAYSNAQALISDVSATEEDYENEYNTLSAAYAAAEASMVPVSDGYYYIVSADPDFMTNQSVEKAMSVGDNYSMTWETFNDSTASQLFKITNLTSGNYNIQSVGSNYYLSKTETEVSGMPLLMTATPEVPQVLTTIGKTGQWKLSNTTYSMAYTMSDYDNGNGVSGAISILEAGANSPSAWYLRKLTDEELIDQLVSEGENSAMIMALTNSVYEANVAYSKTIDHDPLVTSVSQLSTNSSSDNDHSSLAHLIDGNIDYEHGFHSIWNAAMAESSTTESIWQSTLSDLVQTNPANIAVGTGYHNLQVKFNTPMQQFFFTYYNRTGTTVVDNPTDIEIYATNDDDLGASADQADLGDWTKITELTEGFPGSVQGAAYTSPTIDMGAAYKYVRFVIKNTSLMNQASYRTFMVPDITGVTWNVGEFQLYDVNASTTTSEYYKVPGMKEACDELLALINSVNEKLANGTAQYSDTTAINEATRKVNSLYVDRTTLYNQLVNAINEANSTYSDNLNNKITLITNESQLNTNSSSAVDASSLANLIDGNTSTAFHSRWSSDMQNADITEDEWAESNAAFMAGNSNNIAIGTGYHNLQVKFTNAVDSFYFEYTGRNTATYHDNPNDIIIYATNDDDLGTSADESNLDEWTEITELAEGFPTGSLGQYTSPMIDLNGSYKYVRFVIKNTVTAYYTEGGGTIDRLFMNPDVTGVTWNVSEFQAYTYKDTTEMQYYYDSEFKAAMDSMKQLATEYSTVPATLVFSDSLYNILREAIDRVNSMAISSTEADNYFTLCEKMANTTAVGSSIGDADSQEAIDNFKAAIESAKEAYSSSTPTTLSITTAINALTTAYDAFMEHVHQIEAGTWYNILSGATTEAYINQPIYLASTSVGSNLSFGNYSEDLSASADPMAIWRFVPIEGSDNEYAIQSMATGQYFGGYRGNGTSYNPLLSHEKVPYKIIYYGNGNFKLRQASVDNILNSLRANVVSNMVINSEAVDDDEQSWSFVPVSESNVELSIFTDNSIQILVLPFATTGDNAISALNDGVTTYTIMSVDTTTNNLKLKKQTDFEAGEPMVIMINDYTGTNHDPVTLSLATPSDVVDHSDIVNNGLVGTLEGGTITVNGAGYFYNNMLKVAGKNGVVLSGLSGYIDPSQVVNEEGTADLEINAKDFVTDVDKVETVTSDYVDVYTIDGVLVKKHVKAANALDGLSKGIYIVGKTKKYVD